MSLRKTKVSKKTLIITYYWPPAGGPGVQRWLKFVSIFSKKSSKTISKGIISEDKAQSFIEKLLLYVRGNFFIPDARVGWVKPSVSFLLDYIKKENIDTIITTGPPHSVHLIGLQLKEKLGVKWLADFRDPWTTIGYHKQLPDILWRVLNELVAENEAFSKDFQLNFVGAVSKHVLASIREYKLSGYVNNVGYVSHQEAIAYQKKSQLLVLIEIDSEDTKCIIPGKLFEYMVSNRPIVALGPEGSDVEKIIKETNTGNYFSYSDSESLANLL